MIYIVSYTYFSSSTVMLTTCISFHARQVRASYILPANENYTGWL